ncbi:MAG: hypothetical protein PHV39_03415 [Methanomicrobium sp.]|nr:hypothetical protein [Methanomicrobium sp.]
MRKIEIALIAGILVYVLIVLWQAVQKTALLIQAAGLIAALVILIVLLKAKHDEKIKCVEMAALWGCIYLFILYGILVVTGVL